MAKEWEELNAKAAKLQVKLNELELGSAEFDESLRATRAEWRRKSLAYDVDGIGASDEIEPLQMTILQEGLMVARREYAAAELRNRITAIEAESERLYLNQDARFEWRTPAVSGIRSYLQSKTDMLASGWESCTRERFWNEVRNYGTDAENPLRDLLQGKIVLAGSHEFRAIVES